MSEALLDPFRHDAWATRELLTVCRPLTDEQLEATTTGTYGGIRATLHHLIESEAYYLGLLGGSSPGWYREDPEPPPAMEELQHRAADMAERWEAFLASGPIDPAKPVAHSDFETDAGVLIAQVLNHGNEHRAQIFTVLATLDVEHPELDGWAYGEAQGRYRSTR